MKTMVLIPARSGSVRVKDKNVRVLKGLPLMVWSIRTGLSLGLETYVSTDSKEYGQVAYEAGAKVVYRLEAGENQTDLEVCRQFVGVVPTDIIVYLRPTTPVRETAMVQAAIDGFLGTGLRSVEEMSESGYKCFTISGERLSPLLLYPQSQLYWEDMTDKPNHLCPKTYHPNGYVDLIRRTHINDGTLWGPEKQAFITPRTIEIDTEDDFEYAEYWLSRHPEVVYHVGSREMVRCKGFTGRP